MKPRAYLFIFVLILPLQAGMFNPVSSIGLKPDLPLAVIYIIGLVTSPIEAALAGMAIGILQDIGSVGYIGVLGFTHGIAGVLAGLLGRQVLDLASPSNIAVMAAFSIAESLLIAAFMHMLYGSVPFFDFMLTRVLPRAVSTSLIGFLMLRIISRKGVTEMLTRRGVRKEI